MVLKFDVWLIFRIPLAMHFRLIHDSTGNEAYSGQRPSHGNQPLRKSGEARKDTNVIHLRKTTTRDHTTGKQSPIEANLTEVGCAIILNLPPKLFAIGQL